jgi:methionine-rich copper-binding protein CopC
MQDTQMKSAFVASVSILLLGHSLAAQAHTSVSSTTPKSGAELAQSPPAIEITFRGEARLTSVVAVDANKAERKLEFTPKSSATTFTIANPELKPGRNDIQWKALSKDGHVVSGSLVLTITPKSN